MTKKKEPRQLLLGPVPSALIACGTGNENNIITLAWVGVVNSSPPMLSVAIRPNRHSYALIKKSGEFTVNIPDVDQIEIADLCGNLSGRDIDKFSRFKLTAARGVLSFAPMIEECPISMECRLQKTIELNSHTVFIGEVVSTYVDEDLLDEKGRMDFSRRSLLGFCAGSYLGASPLGLTIGYTQRKDR